ncbi:MAG: hypothetical protein SVV03_06155 [Candidatus Nanohaloarchaea archaeon]|nr:hypothetical protein [Candidatus Nanohaloarchaea archaeon]
MDLDQKLKRKLSDYRSNGFYIDQHTLERLEEHQNLDVWDVITILSKGKFGNVEKNDSKKPILKRYESFKVFMPVSTTYKYCTVLYLLEEKPMVKTVYKLDKSLQEALDQ